MMDACERIEGCNRRYQEDRISYVERVESKNKKKKN